MAFIDSIYEKAKQNKKRIAVPECTNETMLRASVRAQKEGIAEIVFVGVPEEVNNAANAYGIDITGIRIVDSSDESFKTDLAERYGELPQKVLGKKTVARRMAEPMYVAMVMEALGEVDCTFAGLDATTFDVVAAASGVIGLAEGCVTASCLFIAEVFSFDGEQGNCIAMSDGGITVEPTSEQLAGIAISCCESFQALMGREARCAMLSFSTLGSGTGPAVDRVTEAVRIANEKRPEFLIDGEFQADAALVKRVAEKKVKRPSEVAGRANVLVFPEISACNIGSKLVQILADCNTYGPILQGFRLPVCDCSRGDTEQRVFDNIATSSVLAAYYSK
ncbi:MAG: phosphate acetyltransferase [Eubacterium sp.]|nr:phosphate acetyltransferase [Eubacterium sp.]